MPAFWMYATGGVALGSEGFKDSKCWSMEMCPHELDDEGCWRYVKARLP